MNEVIVQLVADIKALEETMLKLKPEFEAYITDLSVDLETRWQVWLDAPISLKNTDGWISAGRLNALPEDYVSYDGPHYAERYQDVNMSYVVDTFSEWFEEYEANSLEFLEDREITQEEAIDALCEEILAKNLHSYSYDW